VLSRRDLVALTGDVGLAHAERVAFVRAVSCHLVLVRAVFPAKACASGRAACTVVLSVVTVGDVVTEEKERRTHGEARPSSEGLGGVVRKP
jgi:hypothetical protein